MTLITISFSQSVDNLYYVLLLLKILASSALYSHTSFLVQTNRPMSIQSILKLIVDEFTTASGKLFHIFTILSVNNIFLCHALHSFQQLLSLVLILVLFHHSLCMLSKIFLIIFNVSIMSPLQRLKRGVGRFKYFKRSEYDNLLHSQTSLVSLQHFSISSIGLIYSKR